MKQVFSRSGQLSEINLHPDALADMVSIMVNKNTVVGNAIDNSFLSTINKILIDKLSIRSFCY